MSSSIPSAVPYFLDLAQTALGDQATVSFGKELSLFSAPITLQVIQIVGDQAPAELGPNYRREETYSMQCSLTAYAGDQDLVARLTEAMAAFGLVEVAVANDASLGGTVRFAQCGNFVFQSGADAQGQSIGTLAFDVRCQARVNSLT
jgi:hypothetical protein